MARLRLAALISLTLPLLIVLAYFSGFENATDWRKAALDTFVAIAVAAIAASCVLGAFGMLDPGMGTSEIVGSISLQAVPGSLGALLARSQFGIQKDEARKRREAGDVGEYFFMAVGAVYLASSIAPTEEIDLIAYKVSHTHVIIIALLSLGIMHAFVFSMNFRGQPEGQGDVAGWALFLRYTVPGYVLSLFSSAYLLWTVGRLDSIDGANSLKMIIALAFPAAVGAATARLVL